LKVRKPADLGLVQKPKTAVEAVYRELRHNIIEGTYPQGSRLDTIKLRNIFQVSGSTLREALTRLASDHLVVMEEQKGFSVAPMSLEDLEDLTRARIMLECAVLRDSILQGDEHWEAQLAGAYHLLTRAEERLLKTPEDAFDEWELRNRQFHEALSAGAESRWLHNLRLTLFQHSERYRRLSNRVASSRENVHAEHRAIFEATMARDSERAERALKEHIEHSLNVLREQVDFKQSVNAAETLG
jgi:GntR family carbon starvation induced transcriptional regulator